MAEENKQQKTPQMKGRGFNGYTGSKAKNFKGSFIKIGKSLSKFKFLVILALAFAIVSTVLNVVAPSVLKGITTHMSEVAFLGLPVDMSIVAHFGIILICIYVTSAVLNALQGFIMSRVAAKVTQKYRDDIVSKINRLPLKYFDSTSVGETLSRITNDVDTLGGSLADSLSAIITSVITMIGTIIMMFINSPILTLVMLGILPISMGFIFLLIKFSQKHFVKQQEKLAEINGQIEEIFSAHNVVKVFGGEKKEQKKFDKTNKELFSSSYKAQYMSGLMRPIMNFMGNLTYVAVCLLGGYIAYKNNDPVFAATLITFVMYMRMFNNQVSSVANISGTLQATAAAGERVFEFIEEKEQEVENKPKKLKKVVGNVEFKNVFFGYDEDKTIIHNFNAKIKAGQKVAIVGPTGAGKTTLVNLLMRFYEINSGDILIDGVSIKDMSREEVRSCFGMVLQDTWLFNGTIRDNISYGTTGKTKEEIENACCFAHIDHFIRSLSGGYDMVIDEKANISQGQKQLLTIARAMVNNSPMLILDEATSSVDTRTEEMIQKAMDKITANKTSFVIAHRLSTIKNADLILVMKDGNIIEQGNHKKLIAKGGFYADLYNSQFSKHSSEVVE